MRNPAPIPTRSRLPWIAGYYESGVRCLPTSSLDGLDRSPLDISTKCESARVAWRHPWCQEIVGKLSLSIANAGDND